MKTIDYLILTTLAFLCFISFAVMVRECESLNLFEFGFLWVSMCVSALISIVLIKNIENKINN